MNFYGHSYVAFKVLGRLNNLIAAGAHIPDFVPFIPDSVFTFEEIHEGGDEFLKFLQKKHPDKADLALAMMTHSVKYGADVFNREINKWLLEGKNDLEERLIQDIMDCAQIDRKATGPRMHNYLWVGMDLHIFYNNKDFVNELLEAHKKIDHDEIAKLLAEGYNKNFNDVKRMVDYMFNQVTPETFLSVEGYAKTFRDFVKGLKEGDNVDIDKAVELFEFIYNEFIDQWKGILEKIINHVSENMKNEV